MATTDTVARRRTLFCHGLVLTTMLEWKLGDSRQHCGLEPSRLEWNMSNPATLWKALLIFFGILAVPWFPFALLGGMAMDAWPRLKAEVVWFLVGVYSYPLMYAVAWFASKRKAWLAFLPALSVAAFFLSTVFD